jgi:hypothetical protein
MAARTTTKIETGRDVTRLLARHGCDVRRAAGSHIVGRLPNGQNVVYYDGELSVGVRCKLVKALAAAGLLMALTALFLALILSATGSWPMLLALIA